jgi:zinc D-Ala-D-Ala dipeptidase
MNPPQNHIPHAIPAADLVDMTPWHESGLLRIELAYAQGDNLLFGEPVYRPGARLWLHRRLAGVVEAAAALAAKAGYRLVLYDGLRTTTAQARMLETQKVKDNPHWLEEPRLLSPPGAGAHPRGMAIDVALETPEGRLLDMGTDFDFLARDPGPDHNPAHRLYTHMTPDVRKNRALLDEFMLSAGGQAGEELFPLPQEWWDYRLPPSVYEHYAPLGDEDLPPAMRMVQG